MNILLLAAGKGERFTKQGYPVKPLIEVDGLPMWRKVLENVITQLPNGTQINNVYVATKKEYGVENDVFKIINLEGQQFGAAYSALQALSKSGLQYASWFNDPLLILNCDQLVFFSPENLLKTMEYFDWDGMLFHFNEPNGENKWGRSVINNNLYKISEIVEKTPVSNHAHCGIYMFRKTKYFLWYAKKMISKDIKVNGEYFLSPVYNEMIKDGKNVYPFWVDKFTPLGIPEELEEYVTGSRSN